MGLSKSKHFVPAISNMKKITKRFEWRIADFLKLANGQTGSKKRSIDFGVPQGKDHDPILMGITIDPNRACDEHGDCVSLFLENREKEDVSIYDSYLFIERKD